MQHAFNQFLRSKNSRSLTNIEQNIKKQEEKILIKLVTTCNNTAILVPDSVGVRYKKLLRDKEEIVVDLSKEHFYEVILGVHLKGHITYTTTRRISSLYESGVILWL